MLVDDGVAGEGVVFLFWTDIYDYIFLNFYCNQKLLDLGRGVG